MQSSHSLHKGLFWIVALGATLAFGAALWLFLSHSAQAIGHPYSIDYGEGPILDQVLRLSRFESIYRSDLSQMPYTIANYPPLYLLVQVPFAWLFGPALWYGRLINLLCILASAVCIGLTVAALTGDRIGGAVAGLTLPAIPYIVHWSAFTRVDSLALALSCAALLVVVRWGDRRSGLIATAALLTAAIYTRQSYGLAAPFAAFVWLLREAPRRRAFALAGYTATFGVALFGVLSLLTGKGFFFNIVTANVNAFYWKTVWNYVQEITEHFPYLLLGSAVLVLGGAWRRPPAWWLLAPYTLGATLSALTIGKDGSNVNYLFEFAAALSFTTGVVVGWARAAKRPWLQALVIAPLIMQIGSLTGWARDYYGDLDYLPDVRADIATLTEMVAAAPGPVLADEYMGLLPLAGKDLAFQPFEFKQLADAGVWDESVFIADVYAQKFALILLYDSPYWNSLEARWTPRMLAAIEQFYERKTVLSDVIVYFPRTFEVINGLACSPSPARMTTPALPHLAREGQIEVHGHIGCIPPVRWEFIDGTKGVTYEPL